MVAKQIGRPKSLNPKNIQTRIRMTIDEAQMLKECAEQLGKTKSEIIIMGIQKIYQEIKK
ncbi:hypothetical protein [Megamonas hypermegale]|uniref:hypothetical protein n=1 Tax=Megamonas hypermegale TaxID=158847 RepID=UPI0026E9F06D|nr:hypothetical protein [Megamonas hypermegale]